MAQNTSLRVLEEVIERTVLFSRWILAPLYLILVAVIILFTVQAAKEAIHLFSDIMTLTETQLVLAMLSLMDMALVANLLVMLIISSYETFVSEIDTAEGQERPSWLGKIDANAVKLKLAVAIVAISSIHLLKAFMTTATNMVPSASLWDEPMFWMVAVHLTFVVSAVGMAWIDRLAFATHREHH